MFSITDTIVAIATPPGRGGIGVVRLSGPAAAAIGLRLTRRDKPFEPRHATLALIRDLSDPGSAAAVDSAIVTSFPAPHSYTGDDVIEISAHGSPIVLQQVVAMAVAEGARLAGPGEFTLRAYLNGRIDLAQAEAVADLIDAATPLQARAAFDQLDGTLTARIAGIDAALFDLIAKLEASVDFPDEGYHFIERNDLAASIDRIRDVTAALLADARRGRLLREGLQVAIVGEPNVGKSSLFNALVGTARAIVTEVPGTTRDLVSETVDLDGLRVLLTDTAGVRDTADRVESEGVSRSLAAAATADVVAYVIDRTVPLGSQLQSATELIDTMRSVVLVANKADLPACSQGWDGRDDDGAGAIPVSALTGAGIDRLRAALAVRLGAEPHGERPAITNVRHIDLVQRAHDALGRAADAARAGGDRLGEEFVLADLQAAQHALEEITGRRTTDDLLAHIFERFCIGK